MPKELMQRYDGKMVETRRFSVQILSMILEQPGDGGRNTVDFYIIPYDALLEGV